MLQTSIVALTTSGHLIVESLDPNTHDSLAVDRSFCKSAPWHKHFQQRADALKDFVPSNGFDQGQGYTSYPHWASHSV
jgi:hypothetical protein